jgi:hypothetical protein
LSYSSETNKIKKEGEYRESKGSRRKKDKKRVPRKTAGRDGGRSRVNQTAKPLKEGKQTNKIK